MSDPPLPEPLTVPMARAPAVTGLSRSSLYRAASHGDIRLLKLGRTTLVCMTSVKRYLASLPTAKLAGSKHGDA